MTSPIAHPLNLVSVYLTVLPQINLPNYFLLLSNMNLLFLLVGSHCPSKMTCSFSCVLFLFMPCLLECLFSFLLWPNHILQVSLPWSCYSHWFFLPFCLHSSSRPSDPFLRCFNASFLLSQLDSKFLQGIDMPFILSTGPGHRKHLINTPIKWINVRVIF